MHVSTHLICSKIFKIITLIKRVIKYILHSLDASLKRQLTKKIYNKFSKQMDRSVQISQIFKINLQNDKI